MSVSKHYNPIEIEDKWYEFWMENGFFHASHKPGKTAYTIVMPPPNITGILHMGHILNNTIQDILIRKARMQGKEACWVPGTDHASIATEAKVVNMLREKGIKKNMLTRKEFIQHVWKWKEKHGDIILEQLKKLGASCDWKRTTFTMDTTYQKAVIDVFVDLYKKGYIYRGLRMINWDCEAQTTISNEEVIYAEEGEESFLYSVKYQLKDSNEYIIIATQRPETIMGDVAVAVNPKDERYLHLVGKKVFVPFINREIPIITDEYVSLDFGTGCLKVTPAHDINDYEIGLRHNLEIIDTIDMDGTLNEKCEIDKYIGKDRFEVRKMIVEDLDKAGILVNREAFITKIGRSERTNSVVEPKLSFQWFIKMKNISKKAHQVMMDDTIRLYPSKFKSTYDHWMKNVRDWCISRQLWWGQRIPAYYYGTGENDYVVAKSLTEALFLAKDKTQNHHLTEKDIYQDPDVLDTWASSYLWPIAVFNGFDQDSFNKNEGRIDLSKNPELRFFYPTDTLVTAPEILFFWVARMIIIGYEYLDKKPFKNVYLTGIVRDKNRKKMSKSLGNSPDPIELIKKYGADGIRTGMLFSSPAGNDLLFDEKLCEQGKKFSNKIWNAFRLINSWKISDIPQQKKNAQAIYWYRQRFDQMLHEIEDHFDKFRISSAIMCIYKLIWDDFCNWYLEWIKPPHLQSIDSKTQQETIILFEDTLKILHPFMPFITEEIWHHLQKRTKNEAIIVAQYPQKKPFDKKILNDVEHLFEVITEIRNIKNKENVPVKEKVTIFTKKNALVEYKDSFEFICCSTLVVSEKTPNDTLSFISKSKQQGTGIEYFVVINKEIDLEKEKAKLYEQIKYAEGFKKSIEKKLDNQMFIKNAPKKVVEMEHKKLSDAQTKIAALTQQLQRL